MKFLIALFALIAVAAAVPYAPMVHYSAPVYTKTYAVATPVYKAYAAPVIAAPVYKAYAPVYSKALVPAYSYGYGLGGHYGGYYGKY